jgi:hypothetical protein
MSRTRSLFYLLASLSLTVYVLTLAPTITWRNDGVDSGDLATAVIVGGVPHPPGYPTYLILGELIKHVPTGDVAYRLNLLSAISAALTVGLVGLVIAQTLSGPFLSRVKSSKELNGAHNLVWVCAVAAALALAFADTFWSQAVIAEVYTLNTFFVAILLYGSFQVRPANERWLVPLMAGTLGVSLGNHLSILLITPLFFWGLKVRWRWQLIAGAFLAFCAGLSVYGIIPVRASSLPAVNWGLPTTWPNFLWLVRAEPYRRFLFALPWQFVPARVVAEIRLLTDAFMGWGVPIGLLGLHSIFRSYRSLAWGSLVSFLLISVYSIGYNTTDSYVFLLPALLIFSIWIGWGLHDLGDTLSQPLSDSTRRYAISLGLILPLLSLWWNFADQNISGDNEAFIFAEQSLRQVAPSAVIITDDDPRTFALWYARYGLELRSDVAIINANLLGYPWYRQLLQQIHSDLLFTDEANRPVKNLSTFIEQNHPRSPIYLATLRPPELKRYQLEAMNRLYRVEEK